MSKIANAIAKAEKACAKYTRTREELNWCKTGIHAAAVQLVGRKKYLAFLKKDGFRSDEKR